MGVHSIIIENRALLRASGIKSTESFGDEKIVLYSECGDLSVSGSGLKVSELDMINGDFEVSGKIDSVIYLSEKRHIPDNFISKLFR